MSQNLPNTGQSYENPLIDLTRQSLVLIKPHAVYSGSEVEIRTFLERNRFTVTGQRRFLLTEAIIRQLYRDRLMDLTETTINAMIGTVVMIEITSEGDTIGDVWHLVGNEDPAEAKIGTLRRMYGITREYNAVFAPKNETTFKKLIGIFELWHSIYIQALGHHDAEALVWANEQFNRIMGQGGEESAGSGEVELDTADSAPPAPESEFSAMPEFKSEWESEFIPKKEEKGVENAVKHEDIVTGSGAVDSVADSYKGDERSEAVENERDVQ